MLKKIGEMGIGLFRAYAPPNDAQNEEIPTENQKGYPSLHFAADHQSQNDTDQEKFIRHKGPEMPLPRFLSATCELKSIKKIRYPSTKKKEKCSATILLPPDQPNNKRRHRHTDQSQKYLGY